MGLISGLISFISDMAPVLMGVLIATTGINSELEQRDTYLKNLPNRQYVNPMIIDNMVSSVFELNPLNCPDLVKDYNGDRELLRKYIEEKVDVWDNLYTEKYGKSRYSDMTYDQIIKARNADFCAVSYELYRKCRWHNVEIDPKCYESSQSYKD